MKLPVVIAGLLFIASVAPAQDRNAEKSRLVLEIERSSTIKYYGISITAVSALLTVCNKSGYELWSDEPAKNQTISTIANVGFAVGIPMMIIGAVREGRTRQKLKNLTITPVMTSQSSSLQVTFRF